LICTLTMNPAIDKNMRVGEVHPDRKLRCDHIRIDAGGGGINVSRAIRELGGGSTAIYPAGGYTGGLLQNLLEHEAVDQEIIDVEGFTRESVTVSEMSTDRQYRFVTPGPSLAEGEWTSCLEALSAVTPTPRFVVASGSLPPGVPEDFYAMASRVAQDLHARMIVDTSGAALQSVAKEGAFLFKPNRRELKALIGEYENEEERDRAIIELIEAGRADYVVVSLSAEGALLASAEGVEHLPTPQVETRSRIGAGDSMTAGIVLYLAQGKPVRAAACFGLAAGSSAVTTPGTELCKRRTTENLFAQMSSRWGL
jgi:6-phosphofructokinase 2